jgi:hypothetical protein
MAILTGRDSSGRTFRIVSAVVAAVVLVHPGPVKAGNDNVELRVKAAYLLHFVRYVYWPNSSGTAASAPVILGVLGTDPMVDVLGSTVLGKTVNNRPIKVKVFASPEQIDHCDILFVPKGEAKQTQALLAAISGRPILTVSDSERFSREGGMVEFLLVDDTVRFSINNDAAERAGLKLSSELLRVAYSITGRLK